MVQKCNIEGDLEVINSFTVFACNSLVLQNLEGRNPFTKLIVNKIHNTETLYIIILQS